jgi:uncharacterized SAM-binding protein YcdF (DUF218 family)
MPDLLSEIVFFVLRPSNLLVLILFAGLGCLVANWRGMGIALVALGTVGFVLAGFAPMATLLLRPLEERFDRGTPPADGPAGILVFGGAIDAGMARTRQIPEVNEGADRLIAVAGLARRYPDALVAISNGPPGKDGRAGNAEFAAGLFESFGAARERIRIEDRAGSTWQNAVFLKELLKPEPGQNWIVVTSAWHMPRTMGVMERAGWTGLVPWPVDYRTPGGDDPYAWTQSMAYGLFKTNLAVREWLSLIAYRLTGKTPALVPGPAG